MEHLNASLNQRLPVFFCSLRMGFDEHSLRGRRKGAKRGQASFTRAKRGQASFTKLASSDGLKSACPLLFGALLFASFCFGTFGVNR